MTTRSGPSKASGGGGPKRGRKSPYHESADLLNEILLSGKGKKHGGGSGGGSVVVPASLLKAAAYNKQGELRVSLQTYAVVSKVLQQKAVLDAVLQQQQRHPPIHAKNRGLLYVLLYELLLSSRQKIAGGGALKRSLLAHEAALRAALSHCRPAVPGDTAAAAAADPATRTGSTTTHPPPPPPPPLPRYVRVNTCLTSTRAVLAQWHTLQPQQQKQQQQPRQTAAVAVYADAHVPDLLVVAPYATAAVQAAFAPHHRVILQDKASCFPALCLLSIRNDCRDSRSSRERGDILDACAAPGNKTAHLAALLLQEPPPDATDATVATKPKTKKGKGGTASALLANEGPPPRHTTVYALDRDGARCKLLQQRMAQLVPPSSDDAQNRGSIGSGTATTTTATRGNVAVSVVVRHGDFLATNPADYATVTAIMLDPSCSGSGIYGRSATDHHINDSSSRDDDVISQNTTDRLAKLSGFQITALRHATTFPTVQCIVYSTCSVHQAENEDVVAAVLRDRRGDDGDGGAWELVAPPCLAAWPRRGHGPTAAAANRAGGTDDNDDAVATPKLTAEEAACVIRTNRDDATNGFFVACLRRKHTSTKTTTTTASATAAAAKVTQCNHGLGIPIYNGEFSIGGDAATAAAAAAGPHAKARSTKPEAPPSPRPKQPTARAAAEPTRREDGSGGALPAAKNPRKRRRVPRGGDDDDDEAGPQRSTRAAAPAAHQKAKRRAGIPVPALKKDKANQAQTAGERGQVDITTVAIGGEAPAAATAPKKRAKKLDWKRRQHQAKMERIQT